MSRVYAAREDNGEQECLMCATATSKWDVEE